MKRRVFVLLVIIALIATFLLVCALAASMGKSLFRGKVSQTSVNELWEKSIDYVLTLDAGKDPVLVEQYDNQYSMRIESGNPVTLICTAKKTVSLTLDTDDNQAIAARIQGDASYVLQIMKSCMKDGYCKDIRYDDSIEGIPNLWAYLNEEGIKLLPNADEIESVIVSIHPAVIKDKIDDAVKVGRRIMIPNGLDIYIIMYDGSKCSYLYGAAFDYKLEAAEDTVFIDVP